MSSNKYLIVGSEIKFYVGKDKLSSSEINTIENEPHYYGGIESDGRYLFALAKIKHTFSVNAFPNIGYAVKDIFDDFYGKSVMPGLERCDVIESIDYYPSDNSRLKANLYGGEVVLGTKEIKGGEKLVKQCQNYLDHFVKNGDVVLIFEFDITSETRFYEIDRKKNQKTLRVSGRKSFHTTETTWQLNQYGSMTGMKHKK